jgi:putative transposase
MVRHLRRLGLDVGRRRVRRLMAKMGLAPIYQRPRTSDRYPQHRVYPYLLRGLAIDRPNQVWCADVTYIPMRRGFLYLVAIMDWATRKALAWRLSNTMDASFCVLALEEALTRYGTPEIFNTDQGSQFTWRCLHGRAEGRERPHQHGRARPLDGQCFYRAALAVAEVRMRVPPCLRDGLGTPRRADPLDRLLQCPSATLGACWTDPG